MREGTYQQEEGKEGKGRKGRRERDTTVPMEEVTGKEMRGEREWRGSATLLPTHFLLPRTVENTLCSRLTE